jgi:hypothetical protein
MIKFLVSCAAILLMVGCSNPQRMEQLPPIKSPDTSSQVFLKSMFMDKMDNRKLTFKLDAVPIYRFGDTRQFSFYLDTGTYMFGYEYGSEDCETNVFIEPRKNYLFELGPECRIELISK